MTTIRAAPPRPAPPPAPAAAGVAGPRSERGGTMPRGSLRPAPLGPTFRQWLAAGELVRPLERRAATPGERGPRSPFAEREAARADAPGPEPRAPEEPALAPFRVMPALLGAPERAAPVPVRRIEELPQLAAEFVESMRIGRVGPNGHVVALRIRRGEGTLGVQLRDEGGRLRMQLDGDADGLGERLREALRAEGIEVELG